ncbi:DUF4133 domain-containing protein [Opitutus terrae]|uniref:Transmembrane protein n=1 Tax=Opitutus terrae (strain DSM 11246 / JCM 15787 / PB90-1) TaxID=452637 RepID=B1ZPG5_OPITP|nr:DUF4133 domain-containing protein [Opitutus terrae]ACB74484.1 hypothetical protein Oter_1198 [Opitutus terrae PB90-1]
MDRTLPNEHDANQGAQSKGEFLGMTGNSGWYLLGSAGASILIVILCWGIFGISLLLCLFVGVVLCLLSVAYVFTLKNNKPEHYDTDFFESVLIESGLLELAFGPRAHRPANPFTGSAGPGAEQSDAHRKRAVEEPRVRRTRVPATGKPGKQRTVQGSATPKGPAEEPVVRLSSYERLRQELETTEELLEDALAEQGET